MFVFWFKKIVSPFFLPVPLCLEIMLVGLMLLWFTEKQRLGKIVVSVGIALFAIFGYGSHFNPLLLNLESRYPPLVESKDTHAISLPGELSEIKWIVVLSGGTQPDPQLPLTNQISKASLERLIEGMGLHSQFPMSKLLISGGKTYGSMAESEAMAKVAVALNFPPEDLYLEIESKTTKDHPRFIQQVVHNDPFILVTSASHMPRAMAMFAKQNLHPIPAPSGFTMGKPLGVTPGNFFPSAGGIRKWETVFYELLGQAWAWIRNQI